MRLTCGLHAASFTADLSDSMALLASSARRKVAAGEVSSDRKTSLTRHQDAKGEEQVRAKHRRHAQENVRLSTVEGFLLTTEPHGRPRMIEARPNLARTSL